MKFTLASFLLVTASAQHTDEITTKSIVVAALPCLQAYPQSPRDVFDGSLGDRSPRGSKPVCAKPLANLDMVNIHFHEGAEHKSIYEYDIPAGTNDGVNEGGWLCHTEGLSTDQMQPYDFQYCRNVKVGSTYEVHWVYSSGGPEYEDYGGEKILTDGLNDAFALNTNPFIVVQSQALLLVSDDAFDDDNLRWGMTNFTDMADYVGSSTGTSYSNENCSPLSISWHVDRKCRMLSASSFDNMCRIMNEVHGMFEDLEPAKPRVLVRPQWASIEIFYETGYD
jgi:hypothetical protein